MRTPSSPFSHPGEVPALNPEVMRLAIGTPLGGHGGSPEDSPESDGSESAAGWQFQTRLKFVQVGLWEARRRLLAGQTQDLGTILAHLDEDLELLGQALAEEAPPPSPSRRREPVPVS